MAKKLARTLMRKMSWGRRMERILVRLHSEET